MPDAARLLSRVTDAFVDRASIDWPSLLSRVQSSPDRGLFESLRLLDACRSRIEPSSAEVTGGRMVVLLARAIVVLATIQVTSALVLLGIVRLAGHPMQQRWPNVVLAIAFALGSAVLALARTHDRRRLFLLAALSATAGAFARTALLDLPAAPPGPIDHLMRGLVIEAFVPACVWQFALDFPRVRRFTTFDRAARWGGQGAWTLSLALFAVNCAGAYGWTDGAWVSRFARTDSGHAFWYLWCAVLVWPVLVVLVRARRAPRSERARVGRFATIFAAGTLPLLATAFLRVVSPGVDDWIRSGDYGRAILDLVVLGPLAAVPVLGAGVLLRDRPLDLRLRLAGSWRLVLTRTVGWAAIALPALLLVVTLYRARHLPLAALMQSGWRVWAIAGCAGALALFLMLRRSLFEALDRRWLRRVADHDIRLTLILDRIRLARSSRHLAQVLRDELAHGLSTAVRVLGAAGADRFVDMFDTAVAIEGGTSLPMLLRSAVTPIDLSPGGPLHALLPAPDREWLRRHDVALAAPILDRDGTLVAIILAASQAGVPSDGRHRRFLASAASAAATALDALASASSDAETAAARGTGWHGSPAEDDAAFECPVCGVVADDRMLPCSCDREPMLATLPRSLHGRFLVHRRLGAGGMGIVYLARDTRLGRDVALKTLPALGAGHVARLRDEARAMAVLNHDALATIYGLEIWHRTPVLVVEYLGGGTLAARVAHAPLSVAATLDLGVALARALVDMHGQGLVHRDLKPSNIGFTSGGAPKLLDFGLATWAADRDGPSGLGRRGRCSGTPAYLPPEAWTGASVSPAFDLWALALVLLEAVTGARGKDRGLSLLGEANPDLATFFAVALAEPASGRFPTAAAMLADLRVMIERRRSDAWDQQAR